ncbi:MAG: hypothetical protein ACRYGA_00315 [Janthinobacterium lividum]
MDAKNLAITSCFASVDIISLAELSLRDAKRREANLLERYAVEPERVRKSPVTHLAWAIQWTASL